MRRYPLLIFLLSMVLPILAITQSGYVRTISRPNAPSKRLGGVMLRVRGGHNAVMSTDKGDFSLLMQELHNGDPYALSAVMKSGYQLVEQDVIGRNQAGSDKVPLVISMVSTAQLQADKTAIADKARAEAEKRYMSQMASLEKQLQNKKLEADQYEQQMAALDEQFMRLQTQIDEMAEKYALTDYDALDAASAKINAAIEQGDIDLAERLIQEKGSLAKREEQLHNLQRAAAAQLTDIQRDCYHMYSISLSRFLPDSADYYLRRRAEVDTTNAAAQLDYAKFLNEYQRDRDEAYRYVQRAERWVRRSDGDRSMLMLRVLNEQGQYFNRKSDFQQAIYYFSEAVGLSKELFGADHHYTATRMVSLGGCYYNSGEIKEAKRQLTEAVRIYRLPGQSDSISESNALNTLGGVAFAEKQYSEARTYLEQSVRMLAAASPNDSSLPDTLYNLGAICSYLGDRAAFEQYMLQAYEAARRILGESHHRTQEIKQFLLSIHVTVD